MWGKTINMETSMMERAQGMKIIKWRQSSRSQRRRCMICRRSGGIWMICISVGRLTLLVLGLGPCFGERYWRFCRWLQILKSGKIRQLFNGVITYHYSMSTYQTQANLMSPLIPNKKIHCPISKSCTQTLFLSSKRVTYPRKNRRKTPIESILQLLRKFFLQMTSTWSSR